MPAATLTSKGQITIPKEIRVKLQLEAGDTLRFDIRPNGEVVLRPRKKGDWRKVFGFLKTPGQRTLTIEEMNEVIAKAWAGER